MAYRDSGPPTLSAAQSAQVADLAHLLGLSRWSPMSFLSANSGRANFFFGRGGLFAANCQCCVVAHEARLRGLAVTAVGYSEDVESVQYLLGERFQRAWRTAKGKEPQVVRLQARGAEQLWAKLESETRSAGRYHIGLNFADGSGHIITAERFKDGRIYYYDAQSGEFVNIRSFSRIESLEVLRVDRLLFDSDIVGDILQVI